jgi:hypothetical protein
VCQQLLLYTDGSKERMVTGYAQQMLDTDGLNQISTAADLY